MAVGQSFQDLRRNRKQQKCGKKNFLHFSFVTLCDNFMSPKEVVKVSSGKIHFMLEWLKIYDSTKARLENGWISKQMI